MKAEDVPEDSIKKASEMEAKRRIALTLASIQGELLKHFDPRCRRTSSPGRVDRLDQDEEVEVELGQT